MNEKILGSININGFLQEHKQFNKYGDMVMRQHTPRVVCADGFTMSVQVSRQHYCTPRVDDAEYYQEVEIGYPNDIEPLLEEYAEDPCAFTNTVYPYVPVSVVATVLAKHGGIVGHEPLPTR
jgi:hypothetical protein